MPRKIGAFRICHTAVLHPIPLKRGFVHPAAIPVEVFGLHGVFVEEGRIAALNRHGVIMHVCRAKSEIAASPVCRVVVGPALVEGCTDSGVCRMERKAKRYLNPDIFVNAHGDILVDYLGAARFPLSVIVIYNNIAGVDFNIGNFSADFGVDDVVGKGGKLFASVKVNEHGRFLSDTVTVSVEFSSPKGCLVKPAAIKILVSRLNRVFVEKAGIDGIFGVLRSTVRYRFIGISYRGSQIVSSARVIDWATPVQSQFQCCRLCVNFGRITGIRRFGSGFDAAARIKDYLDPDVFADSDVGIFGYLVNLS